MANPAGEHLSLFNAYLTALLFSLLLTPFPALAQWNLEKEKDGITVYTSPVEGSGFRKFKGTITIESSLDSVMAVMADLDNYPELIDRCISSRLVEEVSFYERYAYQVTKLPWPVKNRDIVVHSLITQDPQAGTINIDVKAANDKTKRTKNVRVTHSVGNYLIESLDDGKVRVTWQQHTDPGGKMPEWLVNTLLTDLPFNTLSNLRDRVKIDKYKLAKLIRDRQGLIIGWQEKSW